MNRFRDTRWFGEVVTEPRDPPSYDGEEIASAHALLKAGVKVVELRACSKVAWQEETEDIVVFANGHKPTVQRIDITEPAHSVSELAPGCC